MIRSSGPQVRAEGKARPRVRRDVRADDGEVAAFNFKNVRAAEQRGSLRAIGVRIGAVASGEVHGAALYNCIIYCQAIPFLAFDVPKLSEQERIERELARLFKQRREALGLSKVVTAQRAGLAVMTIFFVEEMKRSPGIGTLLRIALALEVDLWKMLRDATANVRKN